MKFLIAYGIGLVLSVFMYTFAPTLSTNSRPEWMFYIFIRLVLIPLGLGVVVLYLTGKL